VAVRTELRENQATGSKVEKMAPPDSLMNSEGHFLPLRKETGLKRVVKTIYDNIK
jgi:hypothetical protein